MAQWKSYLFLDSLLLAWLSFTSTVQCLWLLFIADDAAISAQVRNHFRSRTPPEIEEHCTRYQIKLQIHIGSKSLKKSQNETLLEFISKVYDKKVTSCGVNTTLQTCYLTKGFFSSVFFVY